MKLKKLRKTMGCLLVTASMITSLPQVAFAAEQQTDVSREKAGSVTEKTTEPATELLTEKTTEKITEKETETQSGSVVEPGSEQQTEAATESQTAAETESEKTTETAAQTEKETSSLNHETKVLIGREVYGDDDEEDDEEEVDDEEEEDDAKAIQTPAGKEGEKQEDHSDANANLTSNIIAGNSIYLGELSGTYGLTFSDDFEDVMNEIEDDFRQWLEKPDEFLAENWQDVLAVYVLRTRQETESTSITMDEESKEELEKVFFLMNIRSDSGLTKKLSREIEMDKEICSLTVEDYIELKNLDESEQQLLESYTSDKCRQLCAVVTAAKGFVRGEVGEGVSEERIAIVSAACSLVGKVGYFWGGKSYAIGWDSRWGNPTTVTAAGSKSTGTSRGYGLDCSGFVCWSYYNGLNGSDGGIGNHTTTQWNASQMVDSADAKAGDLVFYNSPIAGDQNHVGLVIGKNSDGSLLVVHCSSSQNGVVVGEAWSSGFKYVRSPLSLE